MHPSVRHVSLRCYRHPSVIKSECRTWSERERMRRKIGWGILQVAGFWSLASTCSPSDTWIMPNYIDCIITLISPLPSTSHECTIFINPTGTCLYWEGVVLVVTLWITLVSSLTLVTVLLFLTLMHSWISFLFHYRTSSVTLPFTSHLPPPSLPSPLISYVFAFHSLVTLCENVTSLPPPATIKSKSVLLSLYFCEPEKFIS